MPASLLVAELPDPKAVMLWFVKLLASAPSARSLSESQVPYWTCLEEGEYKFLNYR